MSGRSLPTPVLSQPQPAHGHLDVAFTPEKKIFKEGELIRLQCTIIGHQLESPPLMSWHKHVYYGNTSDSFDVTSPTSSTTSPSSPSQLTDLTISKNKILTGDFKEEKQTTSVGGGSVGGGAGGSAGGGARYTVEIQQVKKGFDHLNYFLNILDAKTSDSGVYFCSGHKDDKFFSQHVLIQVVAPITELKWRDIKPSRMFSTPNNNLNIIRNDDDDDDDDDNGDDVTHLNEGDHVLFRCRVRGGFPQPKVRITVGHRDITHRFTPKVKLNLGQGHKGLQTMSYDTILRADNFKIEYDLHHKNVVCRGEVEGGHANDEGFNRVDELTVVLDKYRPHFKCPHTIKARLHVTNFTIECIVHAKPGINNTEIFFKDAESHTKMVATMRKDYWSSVELVENNTTEHDEQVSMKLVIFEVSEKHFMRYEFNAESELGKSTHVVKLERG
ncbi:hypothetical protein HELRODRAFT_182241 [Helobdella robusta]|uniref:Ig-like domain-containing protein n=1 Tax=Helobdella robusta TaxID=6412 RepID=T1FHZ4_HELRO|nr:hypothetical protein HELRODRAFT_182241 [Helobdella robusta]ESN91086.1 hypothetical protein HELRODRAFT_182241 [Helobdella robusta]